MDSPIALLTKTSWCTFPWAGRRPCLEPQSMRGPSFAWDDILWSISCLPWHQKPYSSGMHGCVCALCQYAVVSCVFIVLVATRFGGMLQKASLGREKDFYWFRCPWRRRWSSYQCECLLRHVGRFNASCTTGCLTQSANTSINQGTSGNFPG